MSRLASQSKGGYYPTPEQENALICRRLKAREGTTINMLDPCCGTGAALEGIARHIRNQGANPVTYGVELEKSRADKAKSRLDYILHEGYEQMRTENLFSLLYLNPPYDNGFFERVETIFLRNLTDHRKSVLQDDGVLVFIVPQATLLDAAGILATRFSELSVYRFTDQHFDEFNQVVLFGRFKRPGIQEKRENTRLLKECSNASKDDLFSLDYADGVTFQLSESKKEPLFRAGVLNMAELLRDVQNSTLFDQTKEIFNNRAFSATFQNPILELKPAHYGVAIASNVMGGNMGDHLLVGGTKKVTVQREKTNDEGEKTGEEVAEFYKSRIRIFSEQGIFDLE